MHFLSLLGNPISNYQHFLNLPVKYGPNPRVDLSSLLAAQSIQTA